MLERMGSTTYICWGEHVSILGYTLKIAYSTNRSALLLLKEVEVGVIVDTGVDILAREALATLCLAVTALRSTYNIII